LPRLTAENHGATVRHFTDEQRGPRWLAGAMTAPVRGRPPAEADCVPHAPTPSSVARRSGFGARALAYLIVNEMLWVVWALTGAGYPWPVWVTGASGLGLLVNRWAGVEIGRDMTTPRS
jgi:hypothetical protein